MGHFVRWLDRVTKILLALGCVATFAMMLQVSADVTSKLAFGIPILGTLEMVTNYYMVAVVFLPLAMVQATRSQIIVEVFTQLLPPRPLAALDGVVALIGWAFLSVLTWKTGIEAFDQTLLREEIAQSAAFSVEVWPARWFVTFGAAAVALNLLVQSAADLVFAIMGRAARWDNQRAGPH